MKRTNNKKRLKSSYLNNLKNNINKFALLWGEAQLCPKVTYSDPKMTHSDPTHLPLPPPTSPVNCQAIVKCNETFGWWWWVVVVVVGGNQL